jgi:hypothetical protein
MGRFFFLTILLLTPVVAFGQERTAEKQITEAVLPLPDSLRGGATVVLDAAPGKRTVLRKGTNQIICRADAPTPGFTVWCYHKDLEAFVTREEQLTTEGKSVEETRDTLSAEVKAGKVQIVPGGTEYVVTGPTPEQALPIMAVFLPNATAESTGLSTEPNNYRPWLMWAGTPVAHVMLPGK